MKGKIRRMSNILDRTIKLLRECDADIKTPEQQVRQEIRSYVSEGINDIHENTLYDMDTVFDELESRYAV